MESKDQILFHLQRMDTEEILHIKSHWSKHFLSITIECRINRAIAELSTVAVTFTRTCDEPLFIEPPDTLSFILFFTGRDSPVREDSSTVDCPSVTILSQGILSPVLTENTDPTETAPTGTAIISVVNGLIKLEISGLRVTIVDKGLSSNQ